MKSKNSIKRFIRITDETGRSRYVRTEAEKARRKEETLSQKLYKERYVHVVRSLISLFFNLELRDGN